jgi:hypothetical protein
LSHGFTPEGKGEVGGNLLSLAEVLGCVVVFEIVQLSQAAEKIGLRGRRA